jgi:hypothetical protein
VIAEIELEQAGQKVVLAWIGKGNNGEFVLQEDQHGGGASCHSVLNLGTTDSKETSGAAACHRSEIRSG